MKKKLADLPPGQQPRVLLVSVDPERDTPAILKPYVTFFDPSFMGATGIARRDRAGRGSIFAAVREGAAARRRLHDGPRRGTVHRLTRRAHCWPIRRRRSTPPSWPATIRKVVQFFEESQR